MDQEKFMANMVGAIINGLSRNPEGQQVSDTSFPFKVGDSLFIRTITHHLTGRVTAITGKFLTLEEAAWIADDGRFSDAINTGNLAEVEPVDVQVYVNTDSFLDVYPWRHALPRVRK